MLVISALKSKKMGKGNREYCGGKHINRTSKVPHLSENYDILARFGGRYFG